MLFKSLLAGLLALSTLAPALADNAPRQTQPAASPEAVSPLLNGMAVPAIEVQNSDGDAVSLNGLLQGKRSLVLFYRGGWCPYCNAQLAGLQEIEKELAELNIQVLALAPEPPEKLKEGEGKGNYTLLSDRNLEASYGFGLAYTLDKGTSGKYKARFGADRMKQDAQKLVVLPAPAAYLVDEKGLVQFSYVNPNYRVRVSPQLLLTAAQLME
ncbi:peroxiredoxin-like family protein [Ferrimonas marina]|uniref:thioredoxin-dependent peroxiredoxin n=1 Tax=Ferrimonas marina TaxID=299255 RepID=A0A1M5X8Z5_9GAMM|nr:peroxiredoxin-like family protein [Ferrimonas marina]SHH95984.1 Peroxiredoxin [Ferrimonas marina]